MKPPGSRKRMKSNVAVEKVRRWKKAWLTAMAMAQGGASLSDVDRTIPDFSTWSTKSLRSYFNDLKDDMDSVGEVLFLDWRRNAASGRVSWLADRFEAWQQSGFGLLELGRLHDVEAAVGRLRASDMLDSPPYAQVLLQGRLALAFRHPEYHLSSDLALLCDLLLDTATLRNEARQGRAQTSSEHTQSLARSAILTCFNLLEVFASGLATAFLMTNSDVPEEVANKLLDNRPSLRKRLALIPALITGDPDTVDRNGEPFTQLMGECKRRRDSFVHCEPGPTPNKYGYVKEDEFHDATVESALKTLDLTCVFIRQVWQKVHGCPGPAWLPQQDEEGRFRGVGVRLIQR